MIIDANTNILFPVVASFGPFTISSLGLFIALAFVFGSFQIWKKMKEEHFEDNDIFDIIFMSFFGGLIGGRLFAILFDFGTFGFDIGKWLSLSYSNQFSWIGFIIGLMYVYSVTSKKRKFEYYKLLDLSVFGVIFTQILIRFGQFLDGSYVGIVTSLPIGLHFPGLEGDRHPLQLYEIIVFVGSLFLIKFFDKHYRLYSWYQDNRGKAHPGFLWLVYLFILLITLFILDFIDVRNTLFWFISVKQVVIFVLLVWCSVAFWMRAGNKLNFSFLDNLVDKSEDQPIREPMSSSAVRERKVKRFSRSRKTKSGKVL